MEYDDEDDYGDEYYDEEPNDYGTMYQDGIP